MFAGESRLWLDFCSFLDLWLLEEVCTAVVVIICACVLKISVISKFRSMNTMWDEFPTGQSKGFCNQGNVREFSGGRGKREVFIKFHFCWSSSYSVGSEREKKEKPPNAWTRSWIKRKRVAAIPSLVILRLKWRSTLVSGWDLLLLFIPHMSLGFVFPTCLFLLPVFEKAHPGGPEALRWTSLMKNRKLTPLQFVRKACVGCTDGPEVAGKGTPISCSALLLSSAGQA